MKGKPLKHKTINSKETKLINRQVPISLCFKQLPDGHFSHLQKESTTYLCSFIRPNFFMSHALVNHSVGPISPYISPNMDKD